MKRRRSRNYCFMDSERARGREISESMISTRPENKAGEGLKMCNHFIGDTK